MNTPIISFDDSPVASSEVTEFEAMSAVMRALQPLTPDARLKVLSAISALLGKFAIATDVSARQPMSSTPAGARRDEVRFSEDRTPSPKEFLFEKKPATDVERIACLAYYLTHYRDTPTFKTLDLSKLNTEAAQLKLSNATQAADNAAKAGLLVPASKGAKQISALGELYVQALPDREAARDAISHAKPKRKRNKTSRAIVASTQHD